MKIPTYTLNKSFNKSVAYFSMEFAVDQSLKTYSGGLGFLAGSHMKSAFELKQNLMGISLLWKYGYYDQARTEQNHLKASFTEKNYNFLEDTGLELKVPLYGTEIFVKAYYLKPETFQTAPLFFLSTDHPSNDHLSRSITHRLYDSNLETRIAQYIVLGRGGIELIKALKKKIQVYHLNEAHALPAMFADYEQHHDLKKTRKNFVFTTHTPVKAGNEENDLYFLHKAGFFGSLALEEVKNITGIEGPIFNHTLAGLKMSRAANAVSELHGQVAREMWQGHNDIPLIKHITNAQNRKYWADHVLDEALEKKDVATLEERKKELKKVLFEEVANQTGKLMDPEICTIVWARRFAEYKRADLITRDLNKFKKLLSSKKTPIQIIWAGKPHPNDEGGFGIFNNLVELSKELDGVAVLTGYELNLSRLLKQGCDIWLNNPRVPKEASGTSGMSASMNASINLSTQDGWMPEFGKDEENCFLLPLIDPKKGSHYQDRNDLKNLYSKLEKSVLPMFYGDVKQWYGMAIKAAKEVNETFESNRMAAQYYNEIY